MSTTLSSINCKSALINPESWEGLLIFNKASKLHNESNSSMQGSGGLDPGLIRMYFVSTCIRYDR